jgi:glycosyltransferase involved in cell wall biosynthesis
VRVGDGGVGLGQRRHCWPLAGGSADGVRGAVTQVEVGAIFGAGEATSRGGAGARSGRRSLRDDYGVPEDRIDVIPPGLWLDKWPLAAERRPGPCRILFVGGDFVRKGGERLVSCLQEIGEPWELDVVTRSDVAGSDRIRVHRDLSQGDPRLLDLYQQADVFGFPSLGDAVPWVVLEAMASQTAVVSTDVGAIPEMVPPAAGIIVASGDGRQLRGALSDLVGNAGKRAAMASSARQWVEAHHDARRQGALILDRMRTVVQ